MGVRNDMKIARRIKTDKRTKSVIKADVHATKIILQYDNMTLNLSTVIAKRIASTLDKAVNIQATRRKDSNPSSPTFSNQILVEPEVQKPIVLSTMERRVEICRYIYQIIKEKHPDIPRYRKTKVQVHRGFRNCTSDNMGGHDAHCHQKNNGKYSQRICLRQGFLLDPLKRNHADKTVKSLYESLGRLMAHEMAHLVITGCRHCKKFHERERKQIDTIYKSINSEKFLQDMPEHLKE